MPGVSLAGGAERAAEADAFIGCTCGEGHYCQSEVRGLRDLLRDVVMDTARCDSLDTCACSEARAHRYLKAQRWA
jgi:hypothetical protein